ncbi:hypothetical protein R3P38DRAFT_2780651 [Favolaschia claudopus]|uniref:Uncharacterized protein n=1 Tax=Favolaschia claudopus TaxID=2862362 RepID=A0AAW0B9T7_9AGAR
MSERKDSPRTSNCKSDRSERYQKTPKMNSICELKPDLGEEPETRAEVKSGENRKSGCQDEVRTVARHREGAAQPAVSSLVAFQAFTGAGSPRPMNRLKRRKEVGLWEGKRTKRLTAWVFLRRLPDFILDPATTCRASRPEACRSVAALLESTPDSISQFRSQTNPAPHRRDLLLTGQETAYQRVARSESKKIGVDVNSRGN